MQRRKEGGSGVPFLPTTAPAGPKPEDKFTLPSNQAKRSTWVLGADGKIDADENDATGLLGALHPLRADKFLEANPTTQPVKSYRLTVRTDSAGGAKSADVVVRFLDRGSDQPYVGDYNGLMFEVPRATFSKFLDADFKVKPAGAGGPPQPQPGAGFPPQ